jgi:Txe/YoeB family toxin of Txe-Axe toxin-antitoxin module
VAGVRRLASARPEDARRISRLILDVQRDPDGTGIGKPELLKGPLSG